MPDRLEFRSPKIIPGDRVSDVVDNGVRLIERWVKHTHPRGLVVLKLVPLNDVEPCVVTRENRLDSNSSSREVDDPKAAYNISI